MRPKPWNPITQLAYQVGVPLIRTYFSSTNVFDSTGASQNDQGDALMSEVSRDLKACRESIGGDVSFTDMLATVYDGSTTRTCVSRTINAGKTSGGLTATALLADPKFNYQVNLDTAVLFISDINFTHWHLALSLGLFFCFSISLSIFLSFYPSAFLSFYPSVSSFPRSDQYRH